MNLAKKIQYFRETSLLTKKQVKRGVLTYLLHVKKKKKSVVSMIFP